MKPSIRNRLSDVLSPFSDCSNESLQNANPLPRRFRISQYFSVFEPDKNFKFGHFTRSVKIGC